jgi:hypothetical protein
VTGQDLVIGVRLEAFDESVSVPLSGRRTVDKIRPHVADVRTSACDVEYTDAPK